MQHERDQLVGGMPTRRLETVNLPLQGASIAEERASARLGYDLRRRHLALVLWHAPGMTEQGELESAADAIAEAAQQAPHSRSSPPAWPALKASSLLIRPPGRPTAERCTTARILLAEGLGLDAPPVPAPLDMSRT
ncbi:hypothetical protein [Streptomyces poonensis]|uniref:Uncharacterized protein n=1 Tax=Streptomyces poonensis TaxID=68255 RepID=A0A918QBB1_9ACTN|nr:hypothetical protein [Streptomyces poonensis]GGZ38032.1 hypothetical protein GCM10010365_68520 [Streptomyces poonensis]GLJ91088.1 hypothetical protein GCM10017589_36940 [Streptomyces poonensis]